MIEESEAMYEITQIYKLTSLNFKIVFYVGIAGF